MKVVVILISIFMGALSAHATPQKLKYTQKLSVCIKMNDSRNAFQDLIVDSPEGGVLDAKWVGFNCFEDPSKSPKVDGLRTLTSGQRIRVFDAPYPGQERGIVYIRCETKKNPCKPGEDEEAKVFATNPDGFDPYAGESQARGNYGNY